MKTTLPDLRASLERAGITVREHLWVPGCLEISGTGDLTALPAFQEGLFLVQDPAASLVSLAAQVTPGQRILDMCAAPGGKSFSAAIAMGDVGSITSCDLHERKLSRIREGAGRLGITCVETAAAGWPAVRAEVGSRFRHRPGRRALLRPWHHPAKSRMCATRKLMTCSPCR